MGKRSGMSRPARPRIRCKLAIIITSSPIRGLQWSAIFRRRDIALGGQGAPLVPAFHHALLGHPTEKRMVLNIGGIRQFISAFPRTGGARVRHGGRVNMLMDAWIWRQCAQPYDKDAAWAKEGQVILSIAAKDVARSVLCCVGAQKYRTRIFQLWLVRASSYGFPWRRRARCTGHAGGADGGLHRPTGAAQWRLRAADGLWRRKPESVSDGPSGGAVARVSRFRPPIRRGSAAMIWKRWPLHGLPGERSRACREIYLP